MSPRQRRHGAGQCPRRRRPLLSLRGVSKSFGAVQALVGVDLDIPAGQVTALAGDNGAGKSVLDQDASPGSTRPTPARSSGRASPVAHPHARATRRRSGSRPSIRTSRCATTSTSSRTCSSAASALRHLRWTRTTWSAAARDAARPRGDDRPIGPAARRLAVRRSAAVGGDRQGGAVELQARDHGRADGGARRRQTAMVLELVGGWPTRGSPCSWSRTT